MERRINGRNYVCNWDNDLKQLRKYRRIRNEISHTPGCDERNMCDSYDAIWIEEFCRRILNSTDPLAEYRKKTETKCQSNKSIQSYGDAPDTNTYHESYSAPSPHVQHSGCAVFFSIILSVMAALIIILLLSVSR